MAFFPGYNHAAVAGDVIVVSMQYSSLHSFNALCFYDTAYISCVVTLHDMCVCMWEVCMWGCVCGECMWGCVYVGSVCMCMRVCVEVCECGEGGVCVCVCGEGVYVGSVCNVGRVCVCGVCVYVGRVCDVGRVCVWGGCVCVCGEGVCVGGGVCAWGNCSFSSISLHTAYEYNYYSNCFPLRPYKCNACTFAN